MQHGKPRRMAARRQPETREGQTGFGGVAEGLVVPMKPGNAGGGKGPWFKATREVARARRNGATLALRSTSGVAEGVTGVSLSLVREPDAGNLHVRFDEGDVETELRRSY